MYSKISSMLDEVAESLESKGLIREASELDKISNTLEVIAAKEGSDKTLIIMRGLPGSGKSTKAKKLHSELGGEVFSTDDYPGLYSKDENGKMVFRGGEKGKDGKPMIVAAHEWNQSRAFDSMASGISPIIVDNTNVQKWEARPYVSEAKKYGYNIAVEEADTPWKFDVKELSGKNTHGVPLQALQGMLDRWEKDFDEGSILKSKAPWEKAASVDADLLKNLKGAQDELVGLVESLSSLKNYMEINRSSMDSSDRRETEEEISESKIKIQTKRQEIDKILKPLI